MSRNWNRPDSYLQAISRQADNGTSHTVTVMVNGLVLTGETISKEAFIEGYTAQWPEDTDPIDIGVQVDPDEDDPTSTAYLHLKDVHVIHPQATNLGGGDFPYWAVRLTSVSGWSLGNPAGGLR
jgi:hypothetical protein